MRYRVQLRIYQERKKKWTNWALCSNSYSSEKERAQAIEALRKKTEIKNSNGQLILRYEYREAVGEKN